MAGAPSHQRVAGAGGCLSPASALLLEAGPTGAPCQGCERSRLPSTSPTCVTAPGSHREGPQPSPWALPKPPSSSHFPLSQQSLFPMKQSLLISLFLSLLGSPPTSISRPSVLPLLPPTSLFIFPRRKMKAKWWPSSRKVSAGWRRPLRPLGLAMAGPWQGWFRTALLSDRVSSDQTHSLPVPAPWR